ncbi:MAG TPA: PIG-L family deacetylase [Terriglobia bacterium]|nr:PIG-L family deacetylase [Terriglobia bacterium]
MTIDEPGKQIFGRREVLKSIAGAAAVLPMARGNTAMPFSGAGNRGGRLKVVVAGAHPDDPESGCGGTMARYADLGHKVFALYLTRGEAGIEGKSNEEAARIRTAEVEKACRILGVQPLFAGQIDGATVVSNDRYDDFRRILESLAPDVVFTHWPIDTHRDHRATSLLVFDTWLKTGNAFALYYFEVMTGQQTSQFCPTDYVDITATEPRKRAACYAHVSQNPQGFYDVHDKMNHFRGMEAGCNLAEAFIRHVQDHSVPLPDLTPGVSG